ncbi:MAG: L-ribulose-5-phosphate 3-epimerase [Brevinema sp.]
MLGLYEKAIPKDISWEKRLALIKEFGFDFMEISIDESDERLDRLDWSKEQKRELLMLSQDIGIPILSMCLSAHRRFPFGSADPKTVQKAIEIMDKALDFASFCGIRNIQLAGYDVYYEESTSKSKAQFKEELAHAVEKASARQIMLSIEIMDHPFMNSIHRYAEITKDITSPWLTVYPDLGNLSAWWNDIPAELTQYISQISAIHLKDTLPIGPKSLGTFRDLILGEGTVDFENIFKTLAKLNYKGSFVLEVWGDNVPDYKKNIINSLEFILQKMKKSLYHLK